MVTEVNRARRLNESQDIPVNLDELIEGHASFPSMRPYLSSHAKAVLYGRQSLKDNPSSMEDVLVALLEEIDRQEQEWNLR